MSSRNRIAALSVSTSNYFLIKRVGWLKQLDRYIANLSIYLYCIVYRDRLFGLGLCTDRYKIFREIFFRLCLA